MKSEKHVVSLTEYTFTFTKRELEEIARVIAKHMQLPDNWGILHNVYKDIMEYLKESDK